MNYHVYLQSRQWREKAGFIKFLACIWRLSPLPFLFGDAHHVKYKNLTKEIYLRDIIVVSPVIHILLIHGILSGFKRPGQQRRYPNVFQSMIHWLYRLPCIGGICIAVTVKLFIQYMVQA